METIHDFLAVHSHSKTDNQAFTFIKDNGEQSQISFNELHKSAQSIAQNLTSEIDAGSRVVLLYPPGLEYIQAFLGCLYAGVVAVPLYPPQSKKHAGRVLTVIDDCQASLVLTNSALKQKLEAELSGLPVASFEELIVSGSADAVILPTVDKIAFLQYTSGSTGTPKGVVVTHGNILANLKTLQQASHCTEEDVFCNWLPLFHDLGLVNTLLLPIYLGAHSVLMSPLRFIKSPLYWFNAITEFKATICGAPNFAFEHCLERIKPHQLVGIDLSSWRIAFNAAEPVDADTLIRFSDRYSRVGFKESAIFPAYGMAEAVVFICGGSHTTPYIAYPFSREALQKGQAKLSNDFEKQQILIAHGHVQAEHDLKIVSPETLSEVSDGQVGEIWFSGPSLAQGYWNDSEKTKASFGARLESNGHNYLRTGDLGFIHENELYISGRIKDVLIIKGRNYYPQDFEKLAYTVYSGLSQNGAAAFEVNGHAILLLEVSRNKLVDFNYQLACETIKSAIFELFEVVLKDIVFLKSGRINRTSSGKIQRSLSKKRYLADDLDCLYSALKGQSKGDNPQLSEQVVAPVSELEAKLCTLWQEIFGLESINVEDNFLNLGGHSLLATSLIAQIRKEWKVDIQIKTFFSAPTIRKLAKVIEQSAISDSPEIVPVSTNEPLPLSFAQQRLWLIEQIEQENTQYNLCKGIKLSGELDERALTLAFQIIIERHLILRTNIHTTKLGEAIQVVQSDIDFSIPKIVLIDLNKQEQEKTVRRYMEKELSIAFDLSKDLMIRVKLVKCHINSHVLLISMHHIAVDGWSEGIIVNELNLLYRSFMNGGNNQGENLPLTNLEIQYADYAYWQRNFLQGDVLENHLQFWKERLQDLPEVHNLALDRPRPAVQNYDGSHYHQVLSADIQIGLNRLARAYDTTLFMVLQTALAILLARHSNNEGNGSDPENIIIGTPVANRDQAELSSLVGFFVNSMVIQNNLSGNPSFDALLQSSKEYLLDAYEHTQLPFEKLVDELKQERNLGYSPLFQVKLALQNNKQGEFDLPDLSCKVIEKSHSVALHDLSLDIFEMKIEGSLQGLKLDWEYATALFDASTIERMGKHFEVLLKGIIETPQARISELPFLSSAEIEQLLTWSKWSSKEEEPGKLMSAARKDASVLQWFEDQVANKPNNIAVVFRQSDQFSEKLSYQELNAKANQVANYLVEEGVKPDTLVGLCVERSLEMIIGIWGILKAGAAYVPIDPDYPEKHIEHILDDSGIEIVLTSSELLSDMPFDDLQILPLDDEMWDSFLGDYDEKNLDRTKLGVTLNHLVYVIYTSGSTGLPKGVTVEHGTLAQSTLSRTEVYQESPDSFALFSSYAFDSSIVGIFWTLVSGGKLCIVDIKQGIDLNVFQTLMTEEKISHFLTLPSVYQTILSADLQPGSSLKTVIVAGETCDQNLVQQYQSQKQWQHCRLFNEYGPTEACVWTSFYDCTHHTRGMIPIGTTVPHAELFVLDNELQLCPQGVTGELYVGGENLARGYLNAPELTNEKFIESPFQKGQRLYKTGDLVRCLPEINGKPGKLEFIGRIDHQIKIRGFRIELGEVETAIVANEQVSEAVVLAKSLDPSQDSKQLVAYVVANKANREDFQGENGFNESAFREALQGYLTKYLLNHKIPSVFVLLDKLPHTPNGKVDRKALQTKVVPIQLAQQYVVPKSDVEKQLCEIWQNLLKLKKVGITENFFSIGGDSILAIQVVTQAGKQGLVFTTRQIFESQTIEKLAPLVNSVSKVLAPQQSISGEQVLIPIQREFLSTDLVEQHHYNQSVLLILPEEFSSDALQKIVLAIYLRHDVLRLSVNENKASYIPFTEQLAERAIRCLDLGHLEGENWESELAKFGAETKAGLSLEEGDVFRVVLFEGKAEQRRLLLTIHHMAVDGVSWRILLQDMASAFDQWQQQDAIALAPKTSSFQQWGEYLLDYANSDDLQSKKDYWLTKAQVQVSKLPLDHEGARDNRIAVSETISFQLREAETQALLNQCTTAYRTQINDLLLSALYLALQQWTGQSVFRIDLESHGRESVTDMLDLTQTMGWFTSVYPVTLMLDSDASIGQVIKTIKEQLRGVLRNGIGFGVLQQMTNDTDRTAFGQAMGEEPEILFNYLGQFDQVVNNDSSFQLAFESAGEDVSLQRQRSHKLELNGMVTGGQLEFSLRYNGLQYTAETMDSLMQGIESALYKIIEHCQSKEADGVTPSDFPLSQVSQTQLDELYQTYPNFEKLYSTTGMQQGLLFHSGLDNSAYLTQLSIDLDGPITSNAMKVAWFEVVRRHDVFRTAFSDDHTHQIVLADVDLPFTELDWSEHSGSEQQQRLAQFFKEDRAQGFDLKQVPLMRITLIALSQQRHCLIWSNHHALSDGWSLPLVFKEVMSIYKVVRVASTGDDLTGLNSKSRLASALTKPQPYESYIAWLQMQDEEKAKSYWMDMLASIEAPTQINVERVSDGQYQGERKRSLSLTQEKSTQLQSLAKQHGVTLNTLIQAAWAYLLHHYSGEEQVVFGETVSGRPAEIKGVEHIVGLFINSLPVLVNIEPEQEIGTWLRTLHQASIDRNEYGFLPLSEIQNLSPVSKNTGRERNLFDSLVVFENYPVDQEIEKIIAGSELSVTHIKSEEETNYALTLMVIPQSTDLHGKLRFELGYRAERYEDGAVTRILGHLESILTGLLDNSCKTVGELPILTSEEERQLLTELNGTKPEYPQDKCIHELFEQRVELNPDAIAITLASTELQGEGLTYGELNAKANKVARYLLEQGIKPDTLVGLCVERSIEMIIGVLGILKAGGAYVPLDPSLPAERLNYIMEDSNVELVLTQKKVEVFANLVDGTFESTNRQLVYIDQFELFADHSEQNVDRASLTLTPNHLAYVIYTSGSTGKPKGVLTTHQNVRRLFDSTQFGFEFGEDDVWTLFHSFAFDFSVWEIWGALFHGGRLLIVPASMTRSMDDFYQLVHQEQVTVLNQTPGAFKQFIAIDQMKAESLSLRYVVFGGEALDLASLSPWVQRHGDSIPKLINMYGITETTVHVTYRQIKETDVQQNNVGSLIGKPLSDLGVVVLDRRAQLTPVGVIGELYISGNGLARGYLNQPELTAEKFVSNPFSVGAPGVLSNRLYKTGDLVRWMPNVNTGELELEFIGRLDHQVKMRGFRIELGEIESRLNQHPEIKESVVIARGEEANKQLIAFYLTKNTEVNSRIKTLDEDLKAHLQQSLPEYMLPTAFVSLEAIPHTPNGKVDRRALERMDVILESNQEYLAPRNAIEEQLVATWAEVLNLESEKIGVNDSFFKLGGHSLLVTQVISKIRRQLDIDLPIKALFEQDNIADLALLIAKTERSKIPAILPINRSELDPQSGHQLPLSFVQERLWFVTQLEPNNPSYNIYGAVTISGEFDIDHLELAFNLIIARHENLRTIFPNQDGQVQQVILESFDFKLEAIDLSHYDSNEARHEKAKKICQTEASTPFDLATGPLLRGKLIKLSADEHIVMLNMHHIITDEESMAILIKEVGVILDCLHQGRNPELCPDLPPLSIQYLDYSIWQRKLLEESGLLELQLAYWQKNLAGVPECLNLATDYPRPSIPDPSGATSPIFRLDTQLTQQLKGLAEQQGCTFYMLLLAAFKVLLYRYTGNEDICLGTPIANRRYEETESLIGMFVNTLALRSQVEGDASFIALLNQVKTTCLEAYEHQDTPFEKIVNLVQPERNTSISAIFQIMFILHSSDPLGSPEQQLQPYPLEYNFSRFDQIIHFTETSEGLEVFIGYRTSLYKPETIERMAKHFIALCRSIIATPTANISKLAFIDEAEKQQLLIDNNNTQADYPQHKCIHQLFIEQVVINPDKTALVQVGTSEVDSKLLSYQQLYDRSHDLALYLQSLGVKPDTLVGMCVGRSQEMMVGILGVLQAGGAYVPLDPDYPDDRLTYMLEDSQVSIVLTLAEFKDKLEALDNNNTKFIVLDEQDGVEPDFSSSLKGEEPKLRYEVKPDNLAYVIYTSGSTGQPKGVMIEHRMVIDYCYSVYRKMDLEQCETFAAVSTFSADLGNIALYVPMMFSKTLYLFSNYYVNHPIKLKGYLDNHPIDCMKITPSHFEMFKISDTEIVTPSKVVIFAGEPLTKEIVEMVNTLNPGCKVFNNYGPTETTISKLSTCELISSEISGIYLGKPLNNTQIYILDQHNNPVPVGVPGELHIAGDGVGRGYLNRPELTEEKFIPNPFNTSAPDHGSRMYKSGDLARWLDDGNIEYLGRIDKQVKIRGFRIELGEIESRLNQRQDIESSVVIVQGQDANKKLVAFYVTANTAEGHSENNNIGNEELREYLLKTLPEYMLPKAFVSIEAIPLTLNGKMDRRALEKMDVSVESNQTYLAPRNDMERQLVVIWADVLNLEPEKVGVNDNFFELGGHSLLAVSVVSKIDNQLGLDLPLYALFESPTISDTAGVLNATQYQLEELWDEDDVDQVEYEEGTL